MISIGFLIFGLIIGDSGVIGNAIILSTFIIAVPQMVLTYVEFRRMKEIEMRFPDFLRDLVESTKAGLPLHKAIIETSRTNYGPLSDEVKRMSNQLTWNISLINTLNQLKKRLRSSSVLSKIIRIMIETYKSGGETSNTLNSLSNALNTIQETQKERESMLRQYVIAMYAISLIFIVIVVAINKLMVPIFENLSGSYTGGASPLGMIDVSPCSSCRFQSEPSCLPCNIYSMICSVLGATGSDVGCYYLALFFSMSFIQALCGGLVAGQIGEGSIKAGMKHSLILLMITCGTFFILVKLGLVGT